MKYAIQFDFGKESDSPDVAYAGMAKGIVPRLFSLRGTHTE